MATTLAQMRTNVSAILGLDNSTTGDQPQIDFYANEAVRKVLADTKCYATSATVTPGATADYALTTAVLELLDVYFTSGGSIYTLERRSVHEILELRRRTAAAGPTRYYALLGNKTMMWYPTPAAADSATLYYVPEPTEASSASHDFATATYGGVPNTLWPALEYYVLWRCADMDDDGSSGSGEKYRMLYEEEIRKARKHLRDRGGSRMGPARLRRRVSIPANPSTSPAWYP